jgi:outer membrane protein OmpA-like peptidoglycan-associated protein
MKKLVSILILVFFICSCASMGQKETTGTGVGALGGAATGAAIGAATGGGNHPSRILIGAVVGALAGGVLGNRVGAYMDDQDRALQSAMSNSIAQNQAYVTRENEKTLVATFKSEVMFDTGSAIMKPGGYDELDRVVNVLNKYPQTTVRIEGYTDEIGSEQSNIELSEKRAVAVQNALIRRGVAPGRMMAVGMGKCCPISSDKAQNRRVNLVIVGNQ